MKYRNLVRSALVAALVVAGSSVMRGEIIEQIIVKVNGEIMTKTELENRQVAALRQMGQQVDAKVDPSDAQLRQMLDQVTPQLLVNAVDEMLLVQRGKELGYTMTNDQFQSVLESIKKDNKIESDEQFQAALKSENMTLSDLRKSLERQMIVSRVQQNEVMGKIAVNDEEARAYYQSHLNEFTSPRTITLREILVNVPGDGSTINVGRDEEARAKIDSMKVGGITEPMRTAKGYQILKLESATTAETKPFEQAREDISNRVFTDKRRDEFEKYLKKLRAQAIIEWKNAEVKKAYDQGLLAPRLDS